MLKFGELGEVGEARFWIFELGKLDEVSSGTLNLGEYDEEVSQVDEYWVLKYWRWMS